LPLPSPWRGRRIGNREPMTLRIERVSAHGRTVVRLIGRLQSECLAEIQAQLEDPNLRLALDLEEVTLVDIGAVRFRGTCERRGIELLHCAPYIRHWMASEADLSGRGIPMDLTVNGKTLQVDVPGDMPCLTELLLEPLEAGQALVKAD
jgi:hypothetical protein